MDHQRLGDSKNCRAIKSPIDAAGGSPVLGALRLAA